MDDSQPFDNTAPEKTSGAVVDVTKRRERSFYDFEHFNKVLMLSENNDQLINRFDRIHSKKGKIIGTVNDKGYLNFMLFGYLWYVHRVIWLLHYKKWPNEFLDHINMNTTDNCILNLREATKAENHHNRKKYSNNTSTQKCIVFYKQSKKWRVRVKVNKKTYFGGYYKYLADAIKVRDEMVNHLHGKFANFS